MACKLVGRGWGSEARGMPACLQVRGSLSIRPDASRSAALQHGPTHLLSLACCLQAGLWRWRSW